MNRADYRAQADYCKHMASTKCPPERKAAWLGLAAAWRTLADGRLETNDAHQFERAENLTFASNIPVQMEEQQLKGRVEELRKIAAKTQNAEDRKKLVKLADDFEAFAHRLLTARFSLALVLRWGRAEERFNRAWPEIAKHTLTMMGKR